MAKSTKNNPRLVLTFLIFAAGILLFLQVLNGFLNDKKSEQTISQENVKTYQSKELNFNASIPSDFEITHHANAVFFTNKNGEIRITKQGTNYDDLNQYLKSSDIAIKNREDIELVGRSVVKGSINESLYYYIYANNVVYSFSTSSEALYDELDQIAQSFRYTP